MEAIFFTGGGPFAPAVRTPFGEVRVQSSDTFQTVAPVIAADRAGEDADATRRPE